jgi:hypothetical protein
MRRSKTLYHELPLFADPLSAGPSHVWESLDDATRGQVVQRLASLLLAYTQTDACPSVSPTNPTHGVHAS